MAVVQPRSQPVQIESPSMGLLNPKALPEGLNPVYLQGKLYKITHKNGSEPRIACAISLLNQLKNEEGLQLSNLKEDKRIGILHVQEGQIKSLTLAKDQIQMMQENQVNEIALKVNNTVLLIKEKMILREFTSEEEYNSYVNPLQQ